MRKLILVIALSLCASSCSVAYTGMGLMYEALGDDYRAIDYFKKTISDDCECEVRRTNLARLYYKTNQHDLAFREFEYLLKFDPHNAFAFLEMGKSQINLGSYDKAIMHITTALNYDDNISDGHYYLAIALMRIGRLKDAIKELNKELVLNPSHENALKELASEDMVEFVRSAKDK